MAVCVGATVGANVGATVLAGVGAGVVAGVGAGVDTVGVEVRRGEITGVELPVGTGDEEVRAVGLAVRTGVAEATGVGVVSGATGAAESAVNTTSADTAVAVGFFPFAFLLAAGGVDDVAVTVCGPTLAPAGTVNDVLKTPLPLAWTAGIPAALPSHVSCTVEWPKPTPLTMTVVPPAPLVGDTLNAGVASDAWIPS